MSVPFGMGKIIDLVTGQGSQGSHEMLLQIGGSLSAVFVLGALANFGRIIIMRTAAERIITEYVSPPIRPCPLPLSITPVSITPLFHPLVA